MTTPPTDLLAPTAELAPPAQSRTFPWTNLVLLLLTVISTIFAGWMLGRSGLFGDALPPLVSGFLFSATLLLILGAHELGHYFIARWHGVDASLPYFIPAPIGLGTFGAFIRMRGPVPGRRALFDVGLAGPLAGLFVAVPMFAAGLLLAPVGFHASLYGNGLLMSGLIKLAEFVRAVPPGHHLLPHPLSFAAYIGLFITAVNLLPVGQLDGGHVAYAMLGKRSAVLGVISMAFLFALGWITGWWSWYIWAGLILLFGLRHPPTSNDFEHLDFFRQLLGLAALMALLLLFASNPFPVFR